MRRRAHPPGFSGYVELYSAKVVSYPSRTDFGLSGKVTRIEPDIDENLDVFSDRLRETLVLAQAEALPGIRDAARLSALWRARWPSAGWRRTSPPAARWPSPASGRACGLRKGQPDATMPLTEGGSITIEEG